MYVAVKTFFEARAGSKGGFAEEVRKWKRFWGVLMPIL